MLSKQKFRYFLLLALPMLLLLLGLGYYNYLQLSLAQQQADIEEQWQHLEKEYEEQLGQLFKQAELLAQEDRQAQKQLQLIRQKEQGLYEVDIESSSSLADFAKTQEEIRLGFRQFIIDFEIPRLSSALEDLQSSSQSQQKEYNDLIEHYKELQQAFPYTLLQCSTPLYFESYDPYGRPSERYRLK